MSEHDEDNGSEDNGSEDNGSEELNPQDNLKGLCKQYSLGI